MIFNIVRYPFYRLYSYYLHRDGERSWPGIAAQATCLLFLGMNFFTAEEFYYIITGHYFLDNYYNHKIVDTIHRYCLAFLLLLFSLAVDRIFTQQGVYRRLINEFKHEDKTVRLKRSIMLWTYTILTTILLLASAYFSKQSHDNGFALLNYFHHYFNSKSVSGVT